MALALTSISPVAGPPGTAITLTGTGFEASSQVACPTLVETTFVSETSLTAAIPEDLEGADGASIQIGVYVRNQDGSATGVLPFTVRLLLSWTSVASVAGEVPNFIRNANISDAQITTWIRSTAQAIAGALLRRGLAIDAAGWQQANAEGRPSPVDVLELINRLGAAARLAAAIAAQFSTGGEWGLAKNLERSYEREMKALHAGDYDKLFRPGAATVESGPQFATGDMSLEDGSSSAAFTREKVF